MTQVENSLPLLDVTIRPSIAHLDRLDNLFLDLVSVEPIQPGPVPGQVIHHNTYSARPSPQGIPEGERNHVVVDEELAILRWGRGWRQRWFRS